MKLEIYILVCRVGRGCFDSEKSREFGYCTLCNAQLLQLEFSNDTINRQANAVYSR